MSAASAFDAAAAAAAIVFDVVVAVAVVLVSVVVVAVVDVTVADVEVCVDVQGTPQSVGQCSRAKLPCSPKSLQSVFGILLPHPAASRSSLHGFGL